MTEPADERPSPQRRGLRIEIAVVLAVTFGLSAYTALLSLIEAVLLGLSGQTIALNPKRSPFDLIDLGFNLARVFQLLAWGALGLYLLWRSGFGPAQHRPRPAPLARHLLGGLGLAALIGLPGLALYQVARLLGIERRRWSPRSSTTPGGGSRCCWWCRSPTAGPRRSSWSVSCSPGCASSASAPWPRW